MKRFLPILAILMLLLAACGSSEPDLSAEASLTEFLTHMKRGEYAKAQEYVYTERGDDLLTEDLENFDGGNRAFVDKLQAFTFEVSGTEESEREATAHLQTTHKNMVPVFTDVMTELTVLIMGDPATQSLNDEQMMQKVNDMLAERTMTMDREQAILDVDKEFAVTLRKDRGRWKVDMDNEELVLMLTGNLFRSPREGDDTESGAE